MAKAKVNGYIVDNDEKWIYDWFDVDATCPKDIDKAIDEAKGEELEIEINSPGGSVWAGSDIYTSLMGYQGNVITKITGVAASAASVIAMAGNMVMISPTAQIMIHNVSNVASGDYRDFEHQSEMLKNYNKSIANAYRLKSKLPENELLEMMDDTTWLTAQAAKEKGFVDEIMFDNNLQLVALSDGLGSSMPISREVIDKMRNSAMNPTNKKLEARMKLLKLRGAVHE